VSIVFSRYDAGKTYAGQKKFDCGNAAINRFVTDNLKKQVAKDLSAAFVLLDAANQDRFVGFYTSMMSAIAADALRNLNPGSLPQRVPCMRLVMLGIDLQYQGLQLGRLLLQHAVKCMVSASDHVGVFGLHLDADSKAVDFYLKHAFVMLEQRQDPQPTPMFLHINTARAALSK
jgi:GNAT superfamily N-acetyltransferase